MSLKHVIINKLSATSNQGGDWMLIMPSGSMAPRDTRAAWSVGDLADMQAIIDRTLAYAGNTQLMVDYDHQGNALREGAGGTAIASGWVQKLEARPDGIWALIEWTQKAQAMIKADEYKYISPLFTSDENRKVDKILNVGLVNMPALDLEAIAAMAEQKPETDKMNFMEKLIKALGLKEGASEGAIIAAIGKMGKPDAVADKAAADLAIGEALKPIALAAGLPEDANADTMISTIKTLADDSGDDKTVVVALQTSLTETKTELAALQSGIARKGAETFIDQAMAEGRAIPANLRDHYVNRHMADAASVETEVNAMPRSLAPTITTITAPKNADGSVALSAEHKDAATLLGLDPVEYAKTLEAEQA